MIVAAIFTGWFLILLVAWALCRVAGTSDKAIEHMHPADWQWPS